jgi:hypothetical protein
MKKSLLLASVFLVLQHFSFTQEQDSVFLKKEAKKKVYTDRPPQSIYFELGGAGLAFSANYDKRFNKQVDGLGFRVGIGYSFTSDFKYTTIPLGVNYLIGDNHKGRFFEAGINGTLLFTGSDNAYSTELFLENTQIKENSTYLISSINVGYRSQPIKGGFNFRVGVSPYFINGNTAVGAYVSLGYNF